MEQPEDTVTAADVTALNTAAVERSAAFARIAGTSLVVVGAIGALAWAWLEVRTQDRAEGPGVIFDDGDGAAGQLSVADRVDLLASSISLLVLAAAVAGTGLLCAWSPTTPRPAPEAA